MGRAARVEYAGATYHVYSRGNRRAAIYRSVGEYVAYLDDLARLTRHHGVEVLAFCLMPNHPHLCLRTTAEGDPLSVLMHRLNLRHARRYNWTYSVTGHLNESRYRAQIVDSERYLLALVRYIHQNPVRARMVGRAGDWAFSSHRAYRGQAWPWVQTAEVLRRAGGREGYERLMAEAQAKVEREAFEPDRRGRINPVVGERSLMAWGPRQRNPWSRRSPARPAADVARELLASLGVELESLATTGQSAPQRAARRALAQGLRAKGYRLQEIAAVLGREEAAVSRLLQRAAGCAETEAEYGRAA